MSTKQAKFGSKLVESKSSMTLRRKMPRKNVSKENLGIGKDCENGVLNKKLKKDCKFSENLSNDLKKGVLCEKIENQAVSSDHFKHLESENLKKKEIISSKRPRRLVKNKENSSNEYIGIDPKPKKRRCNESDYSIALKGPLQLSHEKGKENISEISTDIGIINLKDASLVKSLRSKTNTLNKNEAISETDLISTISEADSATSKSTKKPTVKNKKDIAVKKPSVSSVSELPLCRSRSKRILAKQTSKALSDLTAFSNSSKSESDFCRADGEICNAMIGPHQPEAPLEIKKEKKCKSEGKITNYFNSEILNRNKAQSSDLPKLASAATESSKVNHLPIYNDANKLSEEQDKAKKCARVSDMYNIELDEDMKNSPKVVKKKPKRVVKKSRFAKSKPISKVVKAMPTVKDHAEMKAVSSSTEIQTPSLAPAQDHNNYSSSGSHLDSKDKMDFDPGLTVPSSAQDCYPQQLENQTSSTPEKSSQENRIRVEQLITSSPAPNPKKTNLTSETPAQDSSQTSNGCHNLMTFLTDFEASFRGPHMTSTPDNTEPKLPFKKPVITKKHPAVRMLEISSIPPIRPVLEPNFVSDVEFESPEKIDLSEITLFESPSPAKDEKKETGQLKKAGKKCQTKLNFGKSCNPPQKSKIQKCDSSSISHESDPEAGKTTEEKSEPRNTVTRRKRKVLQEVELSDDGSDFEDDFICFENTDVNRERKVVLKKSSTSQIEFMEVLKPRKSYSPSVKPCFSRTKKANIPVKQYVSKEEKLIQSMNEHFSEVDSLELCIE